MGNKTHSWKLLSSFRFFSQGVVITLGCKGIFSYQGCLSSVRGIWNFPVCNCLFRLSVVRLLLLCVYSFSCGFPRDKGLSLCFQHIFQKTAATWPAPEICFYFHGTVAFYCLSAWVSFYSRGLSGEDRKFQNEKGCSVLQKFRPWNKSDTSNTVLI